MENKLNVVPEENPASEPVTNQAAMVKFLPGQMILDAPDDLPGVTVSYLTLTIIGDRHTPNVRLEYADVVSAAKRALRDNFKRLLGGQEREDAREARKAAIK